MTGLLIIYPAALCALTSGIIIAAAKLGALGEYSRERYLGMMIYTLCYSLAEIFRGLLALFGGRALKLAEGVAFWVSFGFGIVLMGMWIAYVMARIREKTGGKLPSGKGNAGAALSLMLVGLLLLGVVTQLFKRDSSLLVIPLIVVVPGTYIYIMAERRRNELEEEGKPDPGLRSRIADTMAKACYSVTCINRRTGKEHIISRSPEMNRVDRDWTGLKNHDAHIRYYAARMVYEPDREDYIRKARLQTVCQSIKEKGVYEFTYRVTLADGYLYYKNRYMSIGEDNPDYILCEVLSADDELKQRDAVARQLAQEKEDRRRTDLALAEAQEVNKAKSAFLFSMSHDIRTPMNAIIGFTDMAEKYLMDPKRAKASLEKIRISGKRLLEIVDDVLDMARIESGAAAIVKSPVVIRSVLERVHDMFSDQAAKKGLTFILDAADISERLVDADGLHLAQVLSNIVSNAVKYTPRGGRVTIGAKEIEIGDGDELDYMISVSDTGEGMSESFLPRLFDSFAREDNPAIADVQGTGLGMAIVKQLTDLMEGTIDVTGGKGIGTTVCLRFRFRKAAEQRKSEDPKTENRVSYTLMGRRVLLVEDNELNREIARDILEEEGITVEEAVNGRDAVEMLRSAGTDYYDFVLMDIQMPVMDGFAATSAIRELEDGDYSALPIIAMTANAFEEDKRRALAAGMNAHLSKPFSIYDMVQTLESLSA